MLRFTPRPRAAGRRRAASCPLAELSLFVTVKRVRTENLSHAAGVETKNTNRRTAGGSKAKKKVELKQPNPTRKLFPRRPPRRRFLRTQRAREPNNMESAVLHLRGVHAPS